MNDTEEFIKSHREADPYGLALQAAKYPRIDMQYAVNQIRGWQTARRKLPLWANTDGIVYPVHLSMEQCSSQQTAQHKAAIAADWMANGRGNKGQDGGRPTVMADLTGGFGVDATLVGRQFDRLFFVEQNEELCRMARHNLPLLGINHPEVVNHSCEEALYMLPHCDLIFIDPSRRDGDGQRVIDIAACSPNILELQDKLRAKADRIMVKLSPMFGLEALLDSCRGVEKIYIVSVDGECKELLMLMRGGCDTHLCSENVTICCINLTGKGTQSFSFNRNEELTARASIARPDDIAVGHCLYLPNASLMKGGAFKLISQRYDLGKLHNNTHLYTSSQPVDDFPGRTFRITGIYSLNKKDCKRLHAMGKANITVRNFPISANDLHRRLKLAVGGDTYIFAATLADESKALFCCSPMK